MSQAFKITLVTVLLFIISAPAFAQKTINGTVRDARSGETLPSANIIIKDAYRGTITNSDGSYSLTIPDSLLPATVLVRYIGFHTGERVIYANAEARQDFALQPSVTEMEELVVTDEDPAISIMERVIERKQEWRSKLQTYRAEAYTRQNLSNDTALVMIRESVSEVFWREEDGHREVLKWREQTANIDADQNFAGVSYLPNFYDDNVEIAGFDVVGVTHPEALSYYNFKLADLLTLDGQTVYHIKAIPKRKLQPLFKGDLYVLDGEYVLLEVELQPNDVVRFPPPVQDFNLSYSQQYSSYGGDFWLPVDARIHGTIKISMLGLNFPRMNFRQLSKVSDYQVNVPLPDSLYKQDDLFAIDSTAINSDSLKVTTIERVPLSDEEQLAYATLDSTQTLEKAFKPTGFLARFIDMDDEDTDTTRNRVSRRLDIPGSISPTLRFNRVDEFFGGLNYSIYPTDNLRLSVNGGISTGYNEWSYGGGVRYRWTTKRFRLAVGIEYQAQTATRYHSQIIGPAVGSVSNLLGYENYFDYFRDEGMRVFAGVEHRRTDIGLQVGFEAKEQAALQTESGYDILGRSRTPRINPAIDTGRMNALQLQAGYNLGEDYNFGVAGRNRIAFSIEYSDDALGSDFNFTRYDAHLDWSFNTFFKRRVFPNTLNISVDAGTFSGDLPLQKMGIVDVAPNRFFTPFEGLRSVRGQPYEGAQYAAINLEHNFRTVPFELLGLTPLVERNVGLIVFGGAAKTWISDRRMQQIVRRTGYVPNITNDVHVEGGVSVNGLFGVFRVDLAARLDEPAFLVGVSVARFL